MRSAFKQFIKLRAYYLLPILESTMDHPRIKLAEKDVAELKQQCKTVSSLKRQLLLSIRLRKLEAEELLNDPAHGAVAAKELEMARIRYHVFKKSLMSS